MKRTLKRFVGRVRVGRGSGDRSDATPEPDVAADPTKIPITRRTRTALILASLVLLGLVVWYAPSVLSTWIGGFALLPFALPPVAALSLLRADAFLLWLAGLGPSGLQGPLPDLVRWLDEGVLGRTRSGLREPGRVHLAAARGGGQRNPALSPGPSEGGARW